MSGSQISGSAVSQNLDLPISRFLDYTVPRFPHERPGGEGGGGGEVGLSSLAVNSTTEPACKIFRFPSGEKNNDTFPSYLTSMITDS